MVSTRLALAMVYIAVVGCSENRAGPTDPGQNPDTGLISFLSVSSGQAHTCGLALTGTYCWGWGDSVPSRVRGGMTFYAVAANGLSVACGLTTEGAPYCWGPCALTTLPPLYCPSSGLDGSLPVAVPGGHQFSALTIGWGGTGPDHACGLTTEGAAYCWGGNFSGQLGDGTATGSEFGPGGWPIRRSPVAGGGGLPLRAIVAWIW